MAEPDPDRAAYIAEIVASAPRLTDDQIQRLRELMRPVPPAQPQRGTK